MNEKNNGQQVSLASPRKRTTKERALNIAIIAMAIGLVPQIAHAQDAAGAFGGITAFLKSIVNLLIFEWGYYIGIIALAIQGYRWKMGRIDTMALGGSVLGICLVFFAPSIVGDLRSRAGSSLQ